MSKRSRERQLAKLAARRASDRHRRRRRKGATLSVAGVVALAGLVVLLLAFLGRDEPAKRAGDDTTPEPRGKHAAACNAEIPKEARKAKEPYEKAPKLTIRQYL